ncbi:glycosyltransferase family 25 protein [Aeromonas caviae]|uniref:glycosyltransferase family 25 protein n=1 Tax=Aeromonas caviae TaxID=648 RepID=UPI0029DBDAD7|nr:glycosyltransferase family 25 protein [Aeromonas caviae]MDX7789731.1 glycosyltransferase family 25 protein [Aeromonas caviae]MDX7855516.1 glycosyltransferase family 25 protein [Aeromonas caviae]
MNKVMVYVVSLSGSARRPSIEKQLSNLGVNFQFLDAVYGRDLPPNIIKNINDELLVKKRYNRNVGVGEIGCAFSHQDVYKRMSDDCVDFAIILEDDVFVRNKITDFIKFMEEVRFEKHSGLADSLFILGKQDGLSSHEMIVFSNRNKICVSSDCVIRKLNFSEKYVYGTFGYAISSRVASKLVEISNKGFYLADDWSFLYNKNAFSNIYYEDIIVHPPVGSSGSLIEHERMHSSQNSSQRWRYSATRRILRWFKANLRQIMRFM